MTDGLLAELRTLRDKFHIWHEVTRFSLAMQGQRGAYRRIIRELDDIINTYTSKENDRGKD